MDSLVSALSKLFTQAYEQGIADGRSQQAVDHKMIGRKDFYSEFGIKVDTFDKHYRDKEGFPKPEEDGKWYAPAVEKWLLNHQNLSN
ncbi:hypothetical protein ACA593_10320 [Lactiplantibacillus pentosus]|uniref:hypothetical protein n=1 Tax=Lactiplantibacillus TaxID=2767842 RepID=UPI000C7DD31F|nr:MULTISPECIES: hypothetical protein [Lactiplantibacillus]AUI79108.1 hypothetical protein BB562_10640 [Lactiplantibacillus pentosus]MBO9163978.1 hypothetical protein [Lactiplantibacillus pentosus]MCE6030194.1 hypothetical protein [Lactiplantibacillus pentosus]MCT3278649.1 hypothetical protein [Lactiplantibacillus pentosus]MDN7033302.1 hypothetical protein [Lactiplantibacillus plantarum]